jgi:DNA-binding XRE family transcriptional regulator
MFYDKYESLGLNLARPFIPQKGWVSNPKRIQEHIRTGRLDLGLFQRDVAERIGVDKSTVYKWETGRAKPRGKNMAGIIGFLGYNPGAD